MEIVFFAIIPHLMRLFLILTIFVVLISSASVMASSPAYDPETHKRVPEYRYGYIDHTHTIKESATQIAAIYGVSWLIYPATQPDILHDRGSKTNYKNNFGRLVFDKDEPFWNWFVHPISGSQLFLYYRANGYSRIDSLGMAFISSALFELTIEVYSEPASVQDLYQTPIIGALLGVILENSSMYLLNSGNTFGKFMGHLINPATLFWFYDGKVRITPETNIKDRVGFNLQAEF